MYNIYQLLTIFPDIDNLESNTSSTSITHFNRNTRIAVMHSKQIYNESEVFRTSKYWGWIYVTRDTMPNPYNDVSYAYIEELCKTFSNNSKFDDVIKTTGDNVIGEDDKDLLVINSKLMIPGGETGNVLIKDTDGLMKLSGSVTISTIGTKIDGVPVSDFGTNGIWQFADNTTNDNIIHKIATITLPRAGKYLIFTSGIHFLSTGVVRHSAMIRYGQSFGGLADNTNNSATDNSQLRVLAENYYYKDSGTDKHYNICLTCYYEWDGVTTDGEQLHLELDSNNNVVLTSSNGGNSTMIGEAEDGCGGGEETPEGGRS